MNKVRFGSLFIAGLLALCGSAQAVTITTQPTNPTEANEGGPLTLIVAATPGAGASGVLYQWYKDDKLISGATSPTYSIPVAKPTDAGVYFAVAQDNGGVNETEQSNSSTVIIHLKPRQKTPPKSITRTQGEEAKFEVAYTGSIKNESFQWQKLTPPNTWNNIVGANSQSFTINAVAAGDAGKYRVIVNNVTNAPFTSSVATLTVNTVPIITVEPTSLGNPRAIARKGTTILKVVVTGQSPFEYQWQFEPATNPGSGFVDILKATAASYTVKGEETNEGKYRVIIKNKLNKAVVDGGLGIAPTESAVVDVVVDDKPTIDNAGQPAATLTFDAGDDPADITVTPSGTPPFTYQWQKDGKNVAGPARFDSPTDVISDGAGGVLVIDSRNHAIRAISAAGQVSTVFGALGVIGTTNDTGTAARFNLPYGIVSDGAGGYYVTDSGNHTVRHISDLGVVTTLAGDAGTSGFQDETGDLASFDTPTGIAVDSNGNIFVSDSKNHTIRMITTAGVVTTFAGTAGVIGSKNGTGAAAEFNTPMGLAIDSSDNLYVADSGNHCIRIINPAGDVALFSGAPGTPGKVDGAVLAARFNSPVGIEVVATGDILVVERNNHAVRLIAAGKVTTVAGKLATAGAVDGKLTTARFNGPVGIAQTSPTEVCLVEAVSHTVRRYSILLNLVETLGGSPLTAGARDGAAYANEATLKLGPIHWTDRGTYKCIVRNRVGMVTSKTSKVIVKSAPVFLTQPVDTAGATGKTASFSAVVGGDAPLKYEWFYFSLVQNIGDAVSLSNGKLLSSPKLSLTKLTAANEGFYFCKAYNSSAPHPGGVSSAVVRLTILDTPAAIIALTANSNPMNVFGKVPVGGSFTLTATPTAGTGVLRYQWFLGSKNYGAETTSNVLTVDPATADPKVFNHSGAWTVLIRNDAASSKSKSINIQVQTPPSITADPQPVGAVFEDTVTFKVTATGTAPLKYQWYQDGVIMVGKTTASLVMTNVGSSLNNKVYHCVVTNSVGLDTSATALLKVGPPPVPSFTSYYPPQARIGEKVRITGTGLAYTRRVTFGGIAAGFTVEPDGSLLVTVPEDLDTTPSGGFGTLTGGPSVPIFVTTRGGDSSGFAAPFVPFATNTYSNDFRRHATILTGQSVNHLGDNFLFGGGDGGNVYFPSGIGDGSTAWFVWTATETESYTIYAESLAAQDITLAVYNVPYSSSTNEITTFPMAYDDDYFGAGGYDVSRSLVEVDLVAGQQYTIFVGGYVQGIYGPFRLQIFKGPPSLIGLSNGSTPVQSLSAGSSVMGQGRWSGQGDAAAAQVVSTAGGAAEQVVLGGVASEEGVVVWPELTPEEREGKSVLGVNLTFDSPDGPTSDQFNWTLYNQDMEPIGAVWFNNADGSIYATSADGTVVPSTQKILDGTYHLEMIWDASSGYWNATLDGVALFEVLEFPAGTTFGGISAGWVPGSGSGTPASMSFEGLLLPSYK